MFGFLLLFRPNSRYDGVSGFGEFLQMSGIQVTYNLTKPSNERVESVHVLCARCNIPSYYPLNLTSTYKIILSAFLQRGGDGFTMFEVIKYLQLLDLKLILNLNIVLYLLETSN